MIDPVKRFGLSQRAGIRRHLGAGAIAGLVVALSLALAPGASAAKRVLRPDVTVRLVSHRHRSGARRRVVPVGRRSVPLLSPNPAGLREAKAKAASRLSGGGGGALLSPSRSASSPAPRAAIFGGLNKAGMKSAGGATPPDTTGAIGPSNYVEFVNDTGITAYDRSLNPVSGPVGLGAFVGYPGDFVFDPQIQWDGSWSRWIYAMDDIEEGEEEVEPGVFELFTRYYLDFGWSKSGDPTNLSTAGGGGWCGYSIPTGPEFDDFPKLGHGNNGITIGTNVYNLEPEEFLTAQIWSIAKPPSPEKRAPERPASRSAARRNR